MEEIKQSMIITQTPLRISFLGGGTDFKEFYEMEDGIVLSTAIDKYIFVIINERFDDLIYVNYSKKEITAKVENLEHELVREALIKTGIKKGLEITMIADIPSEGSGLGSSSSLTVGLLNALYLFKGEQVTADQLAREACGIEINKCSKPIGKQDQYIAAYGGLCRIDFKKSGNVKVKKLDIADNQRRVLGSNLLLFYTGITRKSSDILTEQKSQTRKNFSSLRAIKKLAIESEKVIKKKNFRELGELMNKNWLLKKKLSSNIVNGEIEEMYNLALNAGASGGKIAGAGGGGFLLLYCGRENQNNVRQALKKYREMPFFLEKDGSKGIFNYKRYSWK
jgi:D-glycero-alpha-D-manno-heptose-7-phosphate kinase